MHLTRDSIPVEDLACDSRDFHSGAKVIFLGKVRNHSQGRKVLYLEYEAYESMAESLIGNLIVEAQTILKIDGVRVLHRLGKVELGEAAVLIEVGSAHRDEAYQASRFLIEGIKHQVPIWKKEYFADGTSEWSLCQHKHARVTIPVNRNEGMGC